MAETDDMRRPRRATRQGVPDPSDRAVATHRADDSLPAESGESGERPSTRWPAIDHVHLRASDARLVHEAWEHVEVWTSHHVYVLDTELVCRRVVDRRSESVVPSHHLVGARLFGGQSGGRDGSARVLSHPFPGYGQAAVFRDATSRRPRLTETSPVERLVLRQRTIVVDEGETPSWERITGRHEAVPPRDDDG